MFNVGVSLKMTTNKSIYGLISVIAVVICCLSLLPVQVESKCSEFLLKETRADTYEKCPKNDQEKFANIPIFVSIYCFNNGSGICKGLAGRYEFYFNTFEDKFLYSAPKSQFVDANGYHERVPVSYNIVGGVNYADRSINWARLHVKKEKLDVSDSINLLSFKDFTWCAFAGSDFWPYKSAVIDAESKGRYHIYFYNRQSCIYDTQSSLKQLFNTRFLHKSQIRSDLDPNPVIFAMEDHISKDVRLVKNVRQHWYEVPFKVLVKPSKDVDLFIDMSDTEKPPCKINASYGHILSERAYRNVSKLCLTDYYQYRSGDNKNGRLVQIDCGLDFTEIADYTYVQYKNDPGRLITVQLHSIPRYPKISEHFYGVDIKSNEDWEKFANDGFSFSATTTIPTKDSKTVRVISLYSEFKGSPSSKYDEFYPMPYLAEYDSTWVGDSDWKFDRSSKQKEMKDLNYVDDIAYLHKCETILVIYGPLYTELPKDQFNLQIKRPVGSIHSLSLFEPTTAFFAVPDSNTIYFYHRLNYMVEHKYTCADPKSTTDRLVTAVRVGKYVPVSGPGQLSWIKHPVSIENDRVHSEEAFFKTIGVFQGDASSPEAPNPINYPIEITDPSPKEEGNPLLIYIIVAIGVLLILAMCITCMVTFRRRRRRRQREMSRFGPSVTNRSALSSKGGSSLPSTRSGLTTSASGHGSHASGQKTMRSSMRSTPASSQASSRAAGKPRFSRSTNSASTVRSAASQKAPGSRASSSNRSRPSSSGSYKGGSQSSRSSRRR